MSVVEWAIGLHSRSSSIASQGNKIEFDCTKTDSTDSSLERDNEFSTRQIIHGTEDASTDGGRNSIDEEKNRNPCASEEACTVREGISIDQNEEYTSTVDYGWPLLRISAPETSDCLRDCEDKTLLNQSTSPTPHSQINSFSPKTENPFQMDIPCSEGKYDENTLTPSTELFLKLVSSRCRQFSYDELKQATSQFSSDNLIGEGGCSNVYKGCLSDGKQAAVKVLRSYKEAWNDFSLEVDITSSLEQKSITTLNGVCIEDNYLILVSDFLPKGSLEENLHGAGEQSVLPWGVRFEVAVAIAEALNYLHSECSRPVIHRDVKSSNILLSSDFQPQLSDFGLAIWGPTDSTHMIREDVVGTFGYIAPEYLMHGKVSDKIDVYSFGVVLLELLSGRRPIGFKNLKGPESLVKWAKPLLKNGDTETLLDPKLSNEYDNAQMQRMLLAANLCINQSPQLRPNMGQVLKLLRGETHATDWVDRHADDIQGSGIQEDDDCQKFSSKPHLDFPILDIDLEATSPSSIYTKSFSGTGEKPTSLIGTERTQHRKLKDYLKEEQD
ncbi:protein kinase domain-containing protein [Citrus sinensis]|nr:protein kinase domain-containing protein [Citrus sinensis]